MKRTLVLLLTGVFLVIAAGCRLPALPAGGPAHPVPRSIDSTGGQDVTEPLNTFMRSVPDGSTITFPAGGRYRIEGSLVLKLRNNLRIEGNGALFFALTDGSQAAKPTSSLALGQHWPRHRGQFEVLQGTNITLRNLIIKGAHPHADSTSASYVPALEAQNAIDFSGTNGAVVENTTISDTYGDFIYMGSDAQNITIRNNSMHRSGRQGVTVADAQHVVINHNQIGTVGRTGIDLETYTASWKVGDVWITDNSVSSLHGYFVAAKGGGDVSNIHINGNRLYGEPMSIANRPPSAVSPRRHDWYVDSNSSDTKVGSPHAPFLFEHTDHVRVTNNRVPLTKGRGQLSTEFVDCTDAVATGNNFTFL